MYKTGFDAVQDTKEFKGKVDKAADIEAELKKLPSVTKYTETSEKGGKVRIVCNTTKGRIESVGTKEEALTAVAAVLTLG